MAPRLSIIRVIIPYYINGLRSAPAIKEREVNKIKLLFLHHGILCWVEPRHMMRDLPLSAVSPFKPRSSHPSWYTSYSQVAGGSSRHQQYYLGLILVTQFRLKSQSVRYPTWPPTQSLPYQLADNSKRVKRYWFKTKQVTAQRTRYLCCGALGT